VSFKELAHAIDDFLGNQSVISMNECDPCNDYFGKGTGTALSKATIAPQHFCWGGGGHPEEKRRTWFRLSRATTT